MKDHSRGLGRRAPSSSLCSSRPGNDDEAGHTHSFKSPVSVTPRLEVWCGLEKLEVSFRKGSGVEGSNVGVTLPLIIPRPWPEIHVHPFQLHSLRPSSMLGHILSSYL